MTAGLMPALELAGACLWSNPAAADFRLCNNTSSRVGIALGYKDPEGWTTEGWWNVSSRCSETLLRGTLVARYYYIYALDYDRGGEWSGQAFMCSRDKEFTIKGTENCLARGFDRTGFFEVDTGEQRLASAMGQFGGIRTLKDLPSKRVLTGYVKKAAKLNEEGVKAPRAQKARAKPLAAPDDLTGALKRNHLEASTAPNPASTTPGAR